MVENLSSKLYLLEILFLLGASSLLMESLLTGGFGAAFLGIVKLVDMGSNADSSSLTVNSGGRDNTEVRELFVNANDISLSKGESSSNAVELKFLE